MDEPIHSMNRRLSIKSRIFPSVEATDSEFLKKRQGLALSEVFICDLPFLYSPKGFTKPAASSAPRKAGRKISEILSTASIFKNFRTPRGNLLGKGNRTLACTRDVICGMLATGAYVHPATRKLTPAPWHEAALGELASHSKRTLLSNYGIRSSDYYELELGNLLESLKGFLHDPSVLERKIPPGMPPIIVSSAILERLARPWRKATKGYRAAHKR